MSVTHEHARAVDTRLAELHGEAGAAGMTLRQQLDGLHWTLNERPVYRTRTRRDWPTTDAEAEQAVRALIAGPDSAIPMRVGGRQGVLRQIGKLGETRDIIRAIEAQIAPLSAEYAADPWPRFWLVIASDGHIHSTRSCSTTFPTTQWGWLPQLSGLTEADAVADQGPRLCSVCYPSAPVEWTMGLPKAPRCPGSGQIGTRVGRTRYGACPVCGDSYALSNVGAIRAHKPKEA